MLQPNERFQLDSAYYFGYCENPSTEAHCNIWDWDQLRMIKIKGTSKVFPPGEDKEVSILAQFADYLSTKVTAVSVDSNGLLIGLSTDPAEDETMLPAYPPLSTVPVLANCCTIYRSKLEEVDRLGPGVDLAKYKDESGSWQKVAFKFNPVAKEEPMRKAWDELHVLRSLPPHPNMVPLDRIVLDDLETRVIGFTTKYIPGGTLENASIPFRLEWLQQLTQLVDFLNFELGIMHQDIAPRNLLIDPDTQRILLFDFNWVACGRNRLIDGWDDVSGVVFTLYEMITNDTSFARIPHAQRDISMVQEISVWNGIRDLDSDVSTFRAFLSSWVATRRCNRDMDRYLHAPNQLSWPDLPTTRRLAKELGQYCNRWERPPQSKASCQ